jgi:hypothetical protein
VGKLKKIKYFGFRTVLAGMVERGKRPVTAGMGEKHNINNIKLNWLAQSGHDVFPTYKYDAIIGHGHLQYKRCSYYEKHKQNVVYIFDSV